MAFSPKLVSSAALVLVAVLLQGWSFPSWDQVTGHASGLRDSATAAAAAAGDSVRSKFEDGKAAATDLLCDRAVARLVDKMEDAAFELLEQQCKALVDASGTKSEKEEEADEEEQDQCLQRGSPGLEKAEKDAVVKYRKKCYDSVREATSSINGGISAGIKAAQEAITDFVDSHKDEVRDGAKDMFDKAIKSAKEQAKAAAEAAREQAKQALAEEKFAVTRPIAAGFQGKGPLAPIISGTMLTAVLGSIACAAALAARRGQASSSSLAGHLQLASGEEGAELMGI